MEGALDHSWQDRIVKGLKWSPSTTLHLFRGNSLKGRDPSNPFKSILWSILAQGFKFFCWFVILTYVLLINLNNDWCRKHTPVLSVSCSAVMLCGCLTFSTSLWSMLHFSQNYNRNQFWNFTMTQVMKWTLERDFTQTSQGANSRFTKTQHAVLCLLLIITVKVHRRAEL